MSEIKGNCAFCSLACPLIIKGGKRGAVFTDDSVLALEWDKSEGSKYGGSLCARGNAAVEFVSHPDRLNYPLVIGERATFEAAVKEAASQLASAKKDGGGDSIGVLVGGNLTNEEASLARKFAEEVLETGNIGLFAPDDIPLFRGWAGFDLSPLASAGPEPEGSKAVSLIVGDSFADHPCTAKDVLNRKYSGRGNDVIVVAPSRTNTAWFASKHLQCDPGGEAAVVIGMLKAAVEKSGAKLPGELDKLINGADWNEIERVGGVAEDSIREAAEAMLGAATVQTYVSNLFGRIGAPAVTEVAAEALTRICPGEASFTTQFVQQNTLGAHAAFAGTDSGKVLRDLADGKFKALVLLGVDIFSEYPAAEVEKALREDTFTLATQMFRGTTAARANVVIPCASLLEKEGTVFPEFTEKIKRTSENIIDPPGGVFTDGELLEALSEAMGKPLKLEKNVNLEIKRSGTGEWLTAEWKGYLSGMKELDGADTILIPLSDPVHVGDGSISRMLSWSRRTSPEPVIVIPNEMAEALNISEGEAVVVKTEGGSGIFGVKASGKMRNGTIGIYIHYPEARMLFPWKLDSDAGELTLMPVGAEISREEKKS